MYKFSFKAEPTIDSEFDLPALCPSFEFNWFALLETLNSVLSSF